MKEENENAILVPESGIRETLEYFLSNTELGKSSGGFYAPEKIWLEEIDNFKKTFRKNEYGEYIVTENKLFDLINDFILHVVEVIAMQLVDEGKMELCWSSEEMDFVIRRKEE